MPSLSLSLSLLASCCCVMRSAKPARAALWESFGRKVCGKLSPGAQLASALIGASLSLSPSEWAQLLVGLLMRRRALNAAGQRNSSDIASVFALPRGLGERARESARNKSPAIQKALLGPTNDAQSAHSFQSIERARARFHKRRPARKVAALGANGARVAQQRQLAADDKELLRVYEPFCVRKPLVCKRKLRAGRGEMP